MISLLRAANIQKKCAVGDLLWVKYGGMGIGSWEFRPET
jgi:hypothetical protein